MLIGADVVDVPMSVVEILSFKSTMIRCAVFNPIPLTVFSNLSFPLLITLQSSEGVRAESIMRAVFPPIPDTLISNRNSSLSCLVANPYNIYASSLIDS